MPCYSPSFVTKKVEVFKEKINFMLVSRIIQRSNSEYSSPIHLIPTKDTGKFRLVGDYLALNQQVIPD